ncbi:MAG TPA: hypothetical protein VGO40_03440 [Longimicrobium sp.]|jgi:hypothetical protein|nr:hypothetical protein [Longimicrobium sp.]
MNPRPVGLRWTVGDVSPPGFEALRLAVWGAWTVFGPGAKYAVCVNTLGVDEARRRTGPLPRQVRWIAARGLLPPWLAPHVDGAGMVEGKAWKFDPFVVYPDRWEISFDNDCILWEMPDSIRGWLAAGEPERCLIAADVCPALGAFARLAGPEPRNAGIRGVPAGFDLAEEMRAVLAENPVAMRSELDEQGLQVAAVGRRAPPVVVPVDEVSICSPFPPHLPGPGRAGAHFVGLNEHRLPWDYYGRPAVECIREHWERLKPEVYARVGITR